MSRPVLRLNCGEYFHRLTLGLLLKYRKHIHILRIFFFLVKGTAADATDAPQPEGLLCNPVMKKMMISFFRFPSNGAPVE